MYFSVYMVRFGSKNGCQKHMCLRRIGLYAHIMKIILVSIINIIERTYITIQWAQNYYFGNEYVSFKNCKERV